MDDRAPGDDRMRVLILSADVGEGHIAAARALAERLADQPTIVVERDGLAAFGPLLRRAIRDGYRLQLRWAPWSYNVSYWTFVHLPAARLVGARALSRSAGRRLLRLVAAERPDIVVSTHPAITAVLGRMRLRRRLDSVLCATVTDLADYAFWSSRGADLHLVMHPAAVGEVERHAGPGSAVAVQPLVSPRFLRVGDRGAARRALDLPADGALVAISGGGWGVGDLAGGVEAAIAAGADTVVVLAGRNDVAQEALRRRFGDEPRVHVWGFTDRMPELLHAADALVHSTGGVTSLEALSCGCPLIAYGATLGHIRLHNERMACLGLLDIAHDREDLRTKLRARLDGHAVRPRLTEGREPGAVVAAARARVLPMPRWRLGVERALTSLACCGVLLWSLATDETYSFASVPLRMTPLSHVATTTRDVGLVVGVAGDAAPRLAARLARDGVHVTLASVDEPSPRGRRAIAARGDDVLPALGAASPMRWMATRTHLHDAPTLAGRRRYLVPPGGLTLGQYVVARSDGAAPLRGQERVDLDAGVPPSSLRPGDIVVAEAATPLPSAASVVRLVAALRAEGLRAVPLSRLAGASSTSNRTAGDVTSRTAAPTTTSSATTRPTIPRAP